MINLLFTLIPHCQINNRNKLFKTFNQNSCVGSSSILLLFNQHKKDWMKQFFIKILCDMTHCCVLSLACIGSKGLSCQDLSIKDAICSCNFVFQIISQILRLNSPGIPIIRTDPDTQSMLGQRQFVNQPSGFLTATNPWIQPTLCSRICLILMWTNEWWPAF